jgi:hypothetical protein
MDARNLAAQPVSKPPKLFGKVKRCVREKCYSLRTAVACVYSIQWHICFYGFIFR